MARIKLEDLPATRDLTPEEMLALFGAGLRRRQLSFEVLEDRRLMSADPTSLVRAQVPAVVFDPSSAVMTSSPYAGSADTFTATSRLAVVAPAAPVGGSSAGSAAIDAVMASGLGGDPLASSTVSRPTTPPAVMLPTAAAAPDAVASDPANAMFLLPQAAAPSISTSPPVSMMAAPPGAGSVALDGAAGVSTGAASPVGSVTLSVGGPSGVSSFAAPPSPAQLDAAATALQAQYPGMTKADALIATMASVTGAATGISPLTIATTQSGGVGPSSFVIQALSRAPSTPTFSTGTPGKAFVGMGTSPSMTLTGNSSPSTGSLPPSTSGLFSPSSFNPLMNNLLGLANALAEPT